MKTAVLLSGGVDSSVAMRLLQRDGHTDLTAFYLKIWLEDELSFLGECPWEDDLSYARKVCEEAGVKLEIVSLQREYHDLVVCHAIEELRAGRTPSPDIWCNERVKFGAFFEHLETHLDDSYDHIASGHYARVERQGEVWHLYRGVDRVKDQTYFLYRLSQAQLSRCLFPLGDYQKIEVRDLAHRFALPNRNRPDSQGICFLGKIRYDDFVRSYLGERPGEIRELESNRVLGEHHGYWFHTIGQRKGLGLSGGPWYVVEKDVERNVILVTHHKSLLQNSRDHFRLVDPHWIGELMLGEELGVKIRHGPRAAPCRLERLENGDYAVRLKEEDPGVAAGQSAVLYAGERCLGGGIIELLPLHEDRD